MNQTSLKIIANATKPDAKLVEQRRRFEGHTSGTRSKVVGGTWQHEKAYACLILF